MEQREHICPDCCWYDGEGFCKHERHWNYERKDKSCKTIVGCGKFVQIEKETVLGVVTDTN